jgi:hypothetical protein
VDFLVSCGGLPVFDLPDVLSESGFMRPALARRMGCPAVKPGAVVCRKCQKLFHITV